MTLLDVVRGGVTVVDLARPMSVGMPQSPNHPEFRLSMPRRHGDMVRADGGSAANDLLVTGTHVGTHIDALGHVSHCGDLYGGVSASEAQVGGRLRSHGVDAIQPMVCRGLLLDVPLARGRGAFDGGEEITVDDLDAALFVAVSAGAAAPRPGDVLLVRSGWGVHWAEGAAFVGRDSGVPGVAADGAAWLAQHQPVAVGADTIAFERIAPGAGHALLPAHRILLVEHGIHIVETLDLEGLSEHCSVTGAYEFVFLLAPLPLVGATGSPVRPLAVFEDPS
jgi:kynurenine formamidase